MKEKSVNDYIKIAHRQAILVACEQYGKVTCLVPEDDGNSEIYEVWYQEEDKKIYGGEQFDVHQFPSVAIWFDEEKETTRVYVGNYYVADGKYFREPYFTTKSHGSAKYTDKNFSKLLSRGINKRFKEHGLKIGKFRTVAIRAYLSCASMSVVLPKELQDRAYLMVCAMVISSGVFSK